MRVSRGPGRGAGAVVPSYGPAGCLGPNAAHLVLVPGPRAGGDDPSAVRAAWVRCLSERRRARGLPDLCAEWAWFAAYGAPPPRPGDRRLYGRLARAAAAHTCAAPGGPGRRARGDAGRGALTIAGTAGGSGPGAVGGAGQIGGRTTGRAGVGSRVAGIEKTAENTAENTVENTLRDVAAYLTRHRVRDAVLGAVAGALPPSGDVVIVAHGLGAVVAVDLMTRLPREVRVTGLVTLGAPLGLEEVRRRLVLGGAVLPRPVPTWLDVWAPGDPLSMGAPARTAWRGQVTRSRELPAAPAGAPGTAEAAGAPHGNGPGTRTGTGIGTGIGAGTRGMSGAHGMPGISDYLRDPVVGDTVGSLLSRVFVPRPAPADRVSGAWPGTPAGHHASCPATVRSGAGGNHDGSRF